MGGSGLWREFWEGVGEAASSSGVLQPPTPQPIRGFRLECPHKGGRVRVGPVPVQEEETAAPPHCTVTSRQRLPFFLQLSLPAPPPPGPWATLTVRLPSLNFTENLAGAQTERQS